MIEKMAVRMASEIKALSNSTKRASYEARHENGLDKDQMEKLFGIYRAYLDLNANNQYPFMKEDFTSIDKCPFTWQDLQELDVQLPLDEIEKIKTQQNVVQLRPVHNETVLVVGCGNKPIANAGGWPMSTQEKEKYHTQHSHPDAVTINPYLATNPTLVGFFGQQTFPMLKKGQFDLIVIEGTEIRDTQVGRDELTRIASEKCKFFITFGSTKGYPFTWELNVQNWQTPGFKLPKQFKDLSKDPCFSGKKKSI